MAGLRRAGEGGSLQGWPAVVVHGAGDVALALARRRGVTLLSARGAASFAGVGWWRALVEDAREGWPGGKFDEVLDCGDSRGRALEALRMGQRAVVVGGAGAALRALAAREGVVLLEARPEALDLGVRGAARRLGVWLGE